MCSLTLLIASRSCTATGTLWCRTCRRLRVPTRPSRSLCKNGQAGIRACAASTVRVSGPNTPDALAAPSLTQARVHTTPVNGREKVIGVKNLPKAELHDRLNVRLPPPATTHDPSYPPAHFPPPPPRLFPAPAPLLAAARNVRRQDHQAARTVVLRHPFDPRPLVAVRALHPAARIKGGARQPPANVQGLRHRTHTQKARTLKQKEHKTFLGPKQKEPLKTCDVAKP